MSNHFTYEIDERKLRVKLKDLETPMSEDAWQKFEAFYSANNKQSSGDIFKNIQIPLSRNVILPAVFGAIIILFSFLLFNFIDIKNPPKAEVQKAEVPAVPAAKPETEVKPDNKEVVVTQKIEEPVKEITNEVKKEPVPVPVAATPSLAAKPVQVITRPVTQATIAAKPVPVITQPVARAVPQPTMPVVARTVPQPATQTSAVPGKLSQTNTSPARAQPTAFAVNKPDTAKKQKRRLPEMAEAEHLPDARPALTTDERETEIRPN